MKLAMLGDSHFDQDSRFEECIRIHEWIAIDASRRGCTAWLHGGDVYERRSTSKEREAVATWVQRMAELVGPGIIVRGNHESIGELPLLQRLDTDGLGVTVVEDARVIILRGIAVACVAWPQTARLLAMLSDVGKEAGEQAAGDALRAVLRGMGAQMDEHRGPRLLLMHAMMRGSVTSTGQPLVGSDLEVGLEDLGLCRADAYLLSHIHRGQNWSIGAAPVVYPGSPRRTAFGEVEEKGYIVAEFDEDGLVGWERITTPCAPMLLFNVECNRRESGEIEWDDDGMPQPDLRGAEIRLRYTVDSDRREAAKAAAEVRRQRMLAAGAVHVKIEEVVEASTKARSPEVAQAVTLDDKLEALWRLQNFEPGDRRPTLLGKVHEIQEAHHAG